MDAESGLAHRLPPPPANPSDVEVAPALLHRAGDEVRGDAGCRGVGAREENRDADVQWRVALRPGRRQLDRSGPEAAAGKRKASARAEVEHPFPYGRKPMRHREWPHPVRAELEHPFPYGKRHFGCAKVRCRRLARNMQRTALLPGCAKVRIAGRCATG